MRSWSVPNKTAANHAHTIVRIRKRCGNAFLSMIELRQAQPDAARRGAPAWRPRHLRARARAPGGAPGAEAQGSIPKSEYAAARGARFPHRRRADAGDCSRVRSTPAPLAHQGSPSRSIIVQCFTWNIARPRARETFSPCFTHREPVRARCRRASSGRVGAPPSRRRPASRNPAWTVPPLPPHNRGRRRKSRIGRVPRMEWSERRRRFRAVLQGSRCVHPGSVFDPISARLAEQLGFEIGMFAGSIASFTVLGNPDLILLTLSEFAEQAYRICRAGSLPLLVDADHGYGNALNVMRTVEELETAGVSALSIEDTALPAGFGAPGEMRLISIDEGVGKLRAALAARQDPNLVIAGRTQAISVSGLADTIARAQAYEASGVDALFFVGVKTRAELDA